MQTGDLPVRFSEVHEDRDPEVVVNRDGAVKHTDHGQPVEFRLHRSAEDIKLRHEPAQRGDPCHREEKDGHRCRKERVFETNP